MDRRDCLRAAGVAGAAALLSAGCSRVAERTVKPGTPAAATPLPPTGDIPRAVRLLHRAGFGPRPGDVAALEQTGAEAWLDRQFGAPAQDDLSPASFLVAKLGDGDEGSDAARGLGVRLRSLEVLHARSPYELRDYKEDEVLRQLQQAAILRAVYSEWQFRERLVDFWANHFNVYARKVLDFGPGAAYAETPLTYFVPLDLHRVSRRHALGRFPDLLKASARSPAMLGFLDNQVNRNGVANENYARELLELHSLGVDGGYTQRDVMEVARCLTGWTVENRFLRRRGEFLFDPARHDNGAKTVLGQNIPAGGGEEDGLRVLEIIAAHPATARHLARKLVRYFRGEEDAGWVSRLSAIYAKTGGDIRAMLRPLLLSGDLPAAPPVLKRPFDFVVSALRATAADTDGGAEVQSHLATMGQPLHQWPMPDGYPDRTAAWTGRLLARWKFAFALASGGVARTAVDAAALGPSPERLIEAVLASRATDASVAETRRALASLSGGEPGEALALLLASPGFQWR